MNLTRNPLFVTSVLGLVVFFQCADLLAQTKIGPVVDISPDRTAGFRYVRTHLNLNDSTLAEKEWLRKKWTVKTEGGTEALFSIDGEKLVGHLEPDTEVKLNSKTWWKLILGNISVAATGNLRISNDNGEAKSNSIFFFYAANDSLVLGVYRGAVFFRNKGGFVIVRSGEYAIIRNNILQGPMTPTQGDIVDSKFDKLTNWKNDKDEFWSEAARKKRLRRLIRTSRFAHINTGSSSPDIREPVITLTSDAFVGQIAIVVNPPGN